MCSSFNSAERMRITPGIALTAAALAAAMVGCATRPSANPTTDYYSASAAPDAATLRGVGPWFVWPWQDQLTSFIEKVDGQPLAPAREAHPPPLAVDPGERSVTVGGLFCCRPRGYFHRGDVVLKTTLLPGHAYRVRMEFREGTMAFWVEDESTREPVSERLTTSTTTARVSGSLNLPIFPL